MLDRAAIALLRPVLECGAHGLQRLGFSANAVTGLGFMIGMAAAVAIAQRRYGVGLALMLTSRLCDGFDGALARLTRPTDQAAETTKLLQERLKGHMAQIGALLDKDVATFNDMLRRGNAGLITTKAPGQQ